MNIIDAIKSGKRFRRKEWGDSSWWSDNCWFIADDNMVRDMKGHSHIWDVEDLTATDWEIESEPKKIKLWRYIGPQRPDCIAYGSISVFDAPAIPAHWEDVTESFKKALGL